MLLIHYLMGLLCAVCCLSCTGHDVRQGEAPFPKILGSSIYQLLSTTTTIDLYDATLSTRALHRLSPEATASLVKQLSRQESYLLDRRKKALFVATIGFIATTSEGETFDIILSYPARQLRFDYKGALTLIDCDPIVEALHTLGVETLSKK